MIPSRSMYIIPIAAMLLSSCSNDDAPVAPVVDLSSTSHYFKTAESSRCATFYKPQVGYVGDPMPFYDPVAKDFKIMYLQEFRPNQNTFHPFWCLTTSDAANYTNIGEVIPTGTASELDAALGTGCTIYNETDRTYYTFYTGHSVNRSLTGIGEGVMMATSRDFKNWTKNTAFLISPEGEYDTTDFRDPCVFKGDDNRYHMVVSTRKEGKGTLAGYVSDDLRSWTSEGAFMTMMWDRFYECPDVFKMGDWWYLVYSEQHAAVRRVQYFKGRTLDELRRCTAGDAGLWPDSREGMLDSRSFYAGKTASDGKTRYIWGWCPTRPGEDNTNVGAYPAEPEWAGALVAHKLVQNADGTLSTHPVDAVRSKAAKATDLKVMDKSGQITQSGGKYTMSGDSHLLFNRLDRCNVISMTVTTSGDSDRFGISLGRGSDSDKYISLVFNPEGTGHRKINMEQEGKNGIGFVNGADGYLFDAPADGRYDITVMNDNSVVTVYVNGIATYTTRVYGLPQNCWSVNNYGGEITLASVKVSHQ